MKKWDVDAPAQKNLETTLEADSEVSLSDISRFSMIKSSVPLTPDLDRSLNNVETGDNLEQDEPMPVIKEKSIPLKKKHSTRPKKI